MKILKTLSVLLIFTMLIIAVAPSKAYANGDGGGNDGTNNGIGSGGVDQGYGNQGNNGNNGKNSDNGKSDDEGDGGSSLPINNHVWFLVIAGVAISTRVILNKGKQASFNIDTENS